MIQVSDLYVDDADYFRIQSLTVGYDFKKIWKSCPFQKLRLYFQAQNLLTITGYDGMDPEQGSSIATESWVTGVDISNYPSPRTFLFGVNVKF
jgi:outer membrane receptor protein involved in Fe transport